MDPSDLIGLRDNTSYFRPGVRPAVQGIRVYSLAPFLPRPNMGNRRRAHPTDENDQMNSGTASLRVWQLVMLNNNFIYFQSMKSGQRFTCQLCRCSLSNLQACFRHIEKATHRDNKRTRRVTHFLHHLPPICEAHRTRLTETIEQVLDAIKMDEAEQARRRKFADDLMAIIGERFPDLAMVGIGSTWNGLCLMSSDVNMNVSWRHSQQRIGTIMSMSASSGDEDEAVMAFEGEGHTGDWDDDNESRGPGPGYFLSDIYNFLVDVTKSRQSTGCLPDEASSPLAVIQNVVIGDPEFYGVSFMDDKSVHYRISTGCDSGPSLNRVISTYLDLHPQIRQLTLLFRHYCSLSHLDKPMIGTFIPTVLPLMVIFYGQHCHPKPLLPNIHQLYRQNKDRVPKSAVTEVFINGHDGSFLSDTQVILDLWAASLAQQKVQTITSTNSSTSPGNQQQTTTESGDIAQTDQSPVVLTSLADLWLGLLRFYLFDFVKSRFQLDIVSNEPIPKRSRAQSLFITDPFRPDRNLCSSIGSDGFVYIWAQMTAAYGYFGVPRKASSGTHLYVNVKIDDGTQTLLPNVSDSNKLVEAQPCQHTSESSGQGHKRDATLYLSPVIDEAKGYDENLVKAYTCLTIKFCEAIGEEMIPSADLTMPKNKVTVKTLLPHMLSIILNEVVDNALVSGIVDRCLEVEGVCSGRLGAVKLTLPELEGILCELATTVWSSIFTNFIRLGKLTMPEQWLVEHTAKPCRLILCAMIPHALEAREEAVLDNLLTPDDEHEVDRHEDEVEAKAPADEQVLVGDSNYHPDVAEKDQEMLTATGEAEVVSELEDIDEAMDNGEDKVDDGYPSTDDNIDYSEVTFDSKHDAEGEEKELEMMSGVTVAIEGPASCPTQQEEVVEVMPVNRETSITEGLAETPTNFKDRSMQSNKKKDSPKKRDRTKKASRPRIEPNTESLDWEMAIIPREKCGQVVDAFEPGYYNSSLVKNIKPEDLEFPFIRDGVYMYEDDIWYTYVLGLDHGGTSCKKSTMVAHYRPLQPSCKACGQVGHRVTACNVASDKSTSFKSWQKMSVRAPQPPSEEHLLGLSECLLQLTTAHDPAVIRQRVASVISFLQSVCAPKFPNMALNIFGSCANGFEMANSDMDVCVFFPRDSIEYDKLQRPKTAKRLITSFGRVLSDRWLASTVRSIRYVLHAKVPIIKVALHSDELDISFSNYLALVNTKMLRMYTEIEPRLRVLGLALKKIVKMFHIGDASIGGISSYGYILMLIYYMQQRNQLPVLQELYDGHRKPERLIDGWNAWYQEDTSKVAEMWQPPENRLHLADLWLGFFRFYLFEFNRDLNVVAIRQKEPLLRLVKMWNSLFAVEDPFKLDHNLTACLTREVMLYILGVFNAVLVHHTTFIQRDMSVDMWHSSLFEPTSIDSHRRLNVPNRFKCRYSDPLKHNSVQGPKKNSTKKQPCDPSGATTTPSSSTYRPSSGRFRPSASARAESSVNTGWSIGRERASANSGFQFPTPCSANRANAGPRWPEPQLGPSGMGPRSGVHLPSAAPQTSQPRWRPAHQPVNICHAAVPYGMPTPFYHPVPQRLPGYHAMRQQQLPAASPCQMYIRNINHRPYQHQQQHSLVYTNQGQRFPPPATKSKGCSPGITHQRQPAPVQHSARQQYHGNHIQQPYRNQRHQVGSGQFKNRGSWVGDQRSYNPEAEQLAHRFHRLPSRFTSRPQP